MDLSIFGGSSTAALFDDGNHGDGAAGDNVFGLDFTIPTGTFADNYLLNYSVTDAQARTVSGSICIAITEAPPAPPANDACANATPISGAGTFAFDSTNATPDGGTALCEGNGSPSVWFAYTGTPGTTATVETCNNANFDTVLAAIPSCDGPEIACNDDTCGTQSHIDLPIATGGTVLIRVSGFGANSGPGSIVIVETAACPADFNHDGSINPDDLGDFINCYFLQTGGGGSCPEADFNGDGSFNGDDLGDFINIYFPAAANGC